MTAFVLSYSTCSSVPMLFNEGLKILCFINARVDELVSAHCRNTRRGVAHKIALGLFDYHINKCVHDQRTYTPASMN